MDANLLTAQHLISLMFSSGSSINASLSPIENKASLIEKYLVIVSLFGIIFLKISPFENR